MNHWNYRIVKKVTKHNDPSLGASEDTWFGIHEVYYDAEGHPEVCSEEPIEPFGESVEEVRESLKMMMKALDKPVLDYDEIGKK